MHLIWRILLHTYHGNNIPVLYLCSLQSLECGLFVLFPYFSQVHACRMSWAPGIVSILFTRMVMKHYTYSNLSENSQLFVFAFFHLISSLAETFVAVNVFSCAYLVNLSRPAHRQIPVNLDLHIDRYQ